MKRFLSLCLALVMVISLVPMAVFAVDAVTISFETDFDEEMTIGDTFTVTGYLANNDLFACMTLSLKWDEDVVQFKGFNVDRRGALVTEVITYTAPVINQELGIITCADAYGYDTNGMIFVANFEIIGSGELGIGLKDADATEFEMATPDMEDIWPVLDFSAVEGLRVGGSEESGVVIPDGAPFTAVTTDAGDIIAIEEQDDVNGVPYYVVTIPEDAETAYVTAPDQVVMEDWDSGEMQATAYAYEVENNWNQLFISYNYEESDDGPIVEIPMYMVGSDWSGEVELCFVEDEDGCLAHVFGIEDANYACLGLISFRYGTAEDGEEEETFNIYVEQTHGGTISVDKSRAAAGDEVFVAYETYTGYRFSHFVVNGEAIYLENGVLMMPSEDVTISAVFEMIPPATYSINVQSSGNGTVTADKSKAAAGEAVPLTVTPDSGYVLDTLTVTGADMALEVINNTFTMPAGAVTVSATFKKMNRSYHFATSADLSAENGGNAVVRVKITGHTDPTVTTYTAYDITLTFDSDKLEYVGYDGAVKSDNGQVKVEGNTIRIVGCGAEKAFDTEIAALTFKTKAEGTANVTIEKVQVSDRDTAIDNNIPEAAPKHDANDTEADETPDQTIVVVPYGVTKPDFVGGADKILHGGDYTFWFTDTANYSYTGLTVTMGGVEVTVPPADANGKFVIANVEGALEITATQTPNSYEINFDQTLVEGDEFATYGTDYAFSVIPVENMEVESVVVLDADGNEMTYTYDSENGLYIIAGGSISGTFEIVVTMKEAAATETTITFDGVEAAEVEGGLVQTAKIGKKFAFKLVMDEKFNYTVVVGETELTEDKGAYTIPADLVVEGGVTVTVIKVAIKNLQVDVNEYINLDGKTMFLVTAKWDDKVLTYGGENMFYSSRYTVTSAEEAGAYCWLVLSTEELNTLELVRAAAEEAIAEGTTTTAISYDFDINETTRVDVNDAQLAYDMYNASYMEFTENLPMMKFLEADVKSDGKLDTQDVAAIISFIINGANA